MALVTKADFSEFVQFTTNTQDRMINYHRDKAETLDFKPLVPASFWTIINTGSPGMGAELEAFFTDYCKPVLVHFFMCRFLVETGVNVTQFGLVNPQDPQGTFTTATDIQRASMRNAYKKDLDSYLTNFYARLKEVDYTFDGIQYDFNCKNKASNLFIRAI